MSEYDFLRQHIEDDRADFDDLKDEMRALRAEMKELNDAVNRYKGFFGAIMLVITCIFSVVHLLWPKG